jgi:hypothetical protein
MMPEISKVRIHIARVNNETEEVPNYPHIVFFPGGGMTQLKALQDHVPSKDKMQRNTSQIKYEKQASTIQHHLQDRQSPRP